MKYMTESIKCHHIDISRYIESNYLSQKKFSQSECIRSYNFQFIKTPINSDDFIYFVKGNYFEIIKLVISEGEIDINKKYIHIDFFHEIQIQFS